ncbi:MAG: hypothetical protein ABIE70_06465 [bacterium]
MDNLPLDRSGTILDYDRRSLEAAMEFSEKSISGRTVEVRMVIQEDASREEDDVIEFERIRWVGETAVLSPVGVIPSNRIRFCVDDRAGKRILVFEIVSS